MSGVLAPQWIFQALTDAGDVASGARLFSFVGGGGSVPSPLYADKALTTPLANPYEFDSAGRGQFWLDSSITYRLRLETATGVLIEERDGVEGAAGMATLANSTDPTQGAGLVGWLSQTVGYWLDWVLERFTLGRKERVSITDPIFAALVVKADPLDPTTWNWAPAIQAAIDEVSAAGGGIVSVPSGDYYLTTGVRLLSNVRIRGVGMPSRFVTPNDIEVIYSRGSSDDDRISHGEIFDLNIYSLVDGVRTKYDIHLQNPNNCKIVRTKVQSSNDDTDYSETNVGGIWLDRLPAHTGSAFMNRVIDCWMQNNSIYFRDITDSIIHGGFVWGHPRQFSIRISSTGPGRSGAIGIEKVVGIIPSKYNGAIWLDGDSLNQIRIEGNEFDGNPALDTGTGVYCPQQSLSVVVSGNTFWGCDKHGIHTITPVGWTISGNSFFKGNASDNFYDDIRIESGAFAPTGISVTGNSHLIDVSRTNKGYAIREVNGGTGNPNKNAYVGNTVSGSTGYQSSPILGLGANNCIFGNVGSGFTFPHQFDAAALVASRVMVTDSSGRPVTVSELTYELENGVAKNIRLGGSSQPGSRWFAVDSQGAHQAGFLIYTDGALTWGMRRQNGGRRWYLQAYTGATGAETLVDNPFDVDNAAGGDILFGGAGRQVAFVGADKIPVTTRTGDATTNPKTQAHIRYTGAGGHTETLPAAKGTRTVLSFRNSTAAASWTISRAGSDVIDNGVPGTPVTSVVLTSAQTLKICDVASGRWEIAP